jgi:hypothetical protein
MPTTIRARVRRAAITAFQQILHSPTFNYVGPLLGLALKALEIYIRPLVTDSNPFVWVDAQFLHDLHPIHELSLDGAKARRALFDYLQDRHPGVETLWHSLVQMYNAHDETHFPEYSTQPMSEPSRILWDSFWQQARQDVPYVYPQSQPLAAKRKDISSSLQGPVNEGDRKKSKNTKKNNAKGSRVVDPVAVSEKFVSVSEAQPGHKTQPASQPQPSAATVKIPPPSSTVQESTGKSAQKQSKKDRKNIRKALKKLEAAERTKQSVAEDCQPLVVGNDDINGGNVTGKKADNGENVIGNNDANSVIGNNNNNDNDVYLPSVEDPADEAPVNEDPAQEDPSNKEPATQNSDVSVAPVYVGISAEKRTLHGSGDDPLAGKEDHANSSDSWHKVEVRKESQKKQIKRKEYCDISKDTPKARASMSAGSQSRQAKAKAPFTSAKPLSDDATSRPMRPKAPVPCEVPSGSRNDNNIAKEKTKSWSALFKDSRAKRESHGSLRDFPLLDANSNSLVQSEIPMDEELSKSSAAYRTTARLPPEDNVPVDSPAIRETDMSHVVQWLARRYASAFVGLTQAEIEDAHWRPEQSNVTVVRDAFTFYRGNL